MKILQMLFFTISINKTTRRSLFSAAKSSNIRSLSHLRGVSTLRHYGPRHNLICRTSDTRPLVQDITLVHYIHDIILTGCGQQEVATTATTACQRVGNKLDKYSEAFHLTEISRGTVVWGMSRWPF